MTSAVYPTLSGLTWPIGRTTSFKTLSETSLARRVASLALQQYPIYEYELTYSILRDDVASSEIRQLVGLFNSCRGRFDSFLFSDPVFNAVTAEPFGTGDGSTTQFQLIATCQNTGGPGGPDIIQNLNGLPTIYDAGTVTTNYTIGPTGIITFVTAPSSGHALTWTGAFYQRCHFSDDMLQAQQILNRWWQITSVKFRSCLL